MWQPKETLEDRGCHGEGCAGCPFQIFEDEAQLACQLERATRYFSLALALGEALGCEQAQSLRQLVFYESLESTLEVWQLPELLSGLEEILSQAMRVWVDERWMLRPEALEQAREVFPGAINTYRDEEGLLRHDLGNVIGPVVTLLHFVEACVRLDRPVVLE